MQMTLDRDSAQPIYLQVAEQIRRRIQSGALPPGTRLPTVRELASQLGITRLTVHSAYNELQAGGWIESTVGRGTFVAAQLEPVSERVDLGREFSARGMISDMLRMAQLPGMCSLAMADAAPEFYPLRELERALQEAITSAGASALSYTTSQGEPSLRIALGEVLRERGVDASPDEIMITSGVTQGMSLIARTLARPGDTVLVEQPTYLGLLNIATLNGLEAVGVPVDEQGMLIDGLEALIVARRPRFIYTIPAFQNPTGACLSPERRSALLAIAERHRVPIVEDDIYGALAYEETAPAALRAADTSGLILYVGSFSKMLMPGLRIGYIVASPALINRLVAGKQADDLCSSPLLQRVSALFIQHGWLAAHLRRVVPRYRERRDALLSAMARYFPAGLHWTMPRGGFSTWVTLPIGVSTTDLYLAGIERGFAFAPGDVFFSGPAPRPYVRICFSTQPAETLEKAAQVLGDLLGSHMVRRSFATPPTDVVPWV